MALDAIGFVVLIAAGSQSWGMALRSLCRWRRRLCAAARHAKADGKKNQRRASRSADH
jgi:hypothetical protein